MNRLASAVLAAAFCVATAGVALAADNSAERMTHALNLLEAQGYGGFTNFAPDGKDFSASVSRNGQGFTVVVDPDSDQITRQS
jgi:hypothetical protein